MILLVLGVLLWAGAHFFKRIAPARRAAMGEPGKGAVSLALVATVLLMIFGYRMAEGAFFWGRSPALTGINNLLMLGSVYLFAAAGMKTRAARMLRHPQLTGFALWCAAHLLVNGADPQRILLMTFSRRAATELTRRVERITTQAMGTGCAAEALTWAGTFHAIGARLLRDHAAGIGLSPDFTIHDREDSADLMNLCRHGLGFSKTQQRFPAKGTCLAIYSRAVNSGDPLDEVLREFEVLGASGPDRARLAFQLARAHSISGDLVAARRHADEARILSHEVDPVQEAEAHALLGRLDTVEDQHDSARSHYQQAALALALAGEDLDRHAAHLWFDLADMLESVGATREAMDALGEPMDKAVLVMDRYGYTGSACVPMALADADAQGRFRPGDLVVLIASGGGAAIAGLALRWGTD